MVSDPRYLHGFHALCTQSRAAAIAFVLVVLGSVSVSKRALAQESVDHGSSPLLVRVLGSGGPGATGRAGSSYLISVAAVPRILIDAGPGSFARLGEAHLSLQDTDLVLLTHLHADHAAELPGLAKARAVAGGGPLSFDVWGPEGAQARPGQAYFPSTSRFIQLLFGTRGAFAYLQDFAGPIHWSAHDLAFAPKDFQPRTIYDHSGLLIRAARGHHGDAPAIIYRVDYAEKSVVVSGDIDVQGLTTLQNLAQGVDLLIADCPVLDPPASPAVLYDLHSPPKAIGEAAFKAGARHLLLSHLSPATEEKRDAVETSIRTHYHGTVMFAADNLQVEP